MADACGFDTSNVANLWKDRVAVELTAAVIYSFQVNLRIEIQAKSSIFFKVI